MGLVISQLTTDAIANRCIGVTVFASRASFRAAPRTLLVSTAHCHVESLVIVCTRAIHQASDAAPSFGTIRWVRPAADPTRYVNIARMHIRMKLSGSEAASEPLDHHRAAGFIMKTIVSMVRPSSCIVTR